MTSLTEEHEILIDEPPQFTAAAEAIAVGAEEPTVATPEEFTSAQEAGAFLQTPVGTPPATPTSVPTTPSPNEMAAKHARKRWRMEQLALQGSVKVVESEPISRRGHSRKAEMSEFAITKAATLNTAPTLLSMSPNIIDTNVTMLGTKRVPLDNFLKVTVLHPKVTPVNLKLEFIDPVLEPVQLSRHQLGNRVTPNEGEGGGMSVKKKRGRKPLVASPSIEEAKAVESGYNAE
ncbi:uncharacterized protein TEOVI_000695600 [Trypanosoma equiperdum]|uniref:Uncharacterized protein n=1 Tax=Trypanosoma equiperdum TaxID=5694 RepID=A0A1G4I4S6_TRYEQ|nr:hypothetical protein, conserved [Trypanosoma equiperdum]